MTSYAYAADAVQTVQLTGSPTGGTFTLTFGGQTTSGIAYNASASTVQSALTALTSIGSGNVVVTLAGSGGWEVRFAGSLAGAFRAELTASGAGLTGGTSPGVNVAVVSAGGDAGLVQAVIDPLGLVSRTYYDALGRTVQTVEDFTDGSITASSNKTTGYTYNAAGMTSLTAYLGAGSGETTAYVYGVTTAGGSGVNSNDVVGITENPDPTTGAPSASYETTVMVNALSQVVTSTDPNGTKHTYTYDVLGRQTVDTATTLGTNIDGSVRRIETAYDGQGNASLITSYDATTGGSVVNQVERLFNGLGQLTAEYQAVGGAVNTSTTPKVQYAYSEMPSGANHSRLTSVTYPDGYVVSYNYASGLDNNISRLASLTDFTGTLESYTYLGLGTVVERDHPESGVNLTYISPTGATGDAGDVYVGLDRFGRVVDQNWYDTGTSSSVSDQQYGYDADGNVVWRIDGVNAAFGELYTYDGLNQLASFARGTVVHTSPGVGLSGSASETESWAYDAVGNRTGVTTNGTSQTYSANAQNEITSISGATTPVFDAVGNMTTDETGRQFVYDGWGRLVAFKNSGGSTLEMYAYDGLGRAVTSTAGGTTTDRYYSDAGQVLEEKAGSAYTTRYLWNPDDGAVLVARDTDTSGTGLTATGVGYQRLFSAQDANGDVVALVNTSGTVVERYAYDPFGSVTVMSGSWSALSGSAYAWVYGLQGMRYDAVNGLNQAKFRWYSPSMGIWTSADPIRFSGGDVNLYRFVGDNPINELDPSGLLALRSGVVSPPADGVKTRLTKEPGIGTIEASKDNNGKKVGTITDGKGNVLEVWVFGNTFYGRFVQGKKPFGKCLPDGGINYWVGGDGKIYWYNIGPNLKGTRRSVIVDAVSAGDGSKLDLATATFDDVHKFVMNSLLKAIGNGYLTALDPSDKRQIAGFQAYETVLYVMEATDKGMAMQVYRLYKDNKTGGLEWKVDGSTQVGADPDIFP